MLNFYVKYFPWAVLAIFGLEIYQYWNVDVDKVLMAIVGAIGWTSFIEVRGDYDSFYNMIMGKLKDDVES